MAIQINFKIALESDTIGSAAVASIDSAVSSGAMAASFTDQAEKRDEVVTVTTAVLETTCATCGVVSALISNDKVAGTAYAVVSSLLMFISMSIFGFWVFAIRDVCKRRDTAEEANLPARVVPTTEALPCMQPNVLTELVCASKFESALSSGKDLDLDQLVDCQGVDCSLDGLEDTENNVYRDTSYRPRDILQAAAVVCG